MTNSTFDYKRILIILPERLGDAIFHTPSIRLLKKMRPDASIGVIALSPLSAGVIENSPYIDHIYVKPSPEDTRRVANDYDVVLNVHNHKTSREYVKWLGIPTLTELPPDPSTHQSQQALDFVKGLLGCEVEAEERRYNLHPTSSNFENIDRLLKKGGVQADDILIGCHIGCHSIAKQQWKFWKPMAHEKVWPSENFILLDAALRKTSRRFRLVLTGSNAEKVLGKKIKNCVPAAIDLIDKTSVMDLAALMNRLHLFVTPDTGALHVACASDIGIVALFGPTSAHRTGPYPLQNNYKILDAATMREITVADVADAIITHPDIVKRLASCPKLDACTLNDTLD